MYCELPKVGSSNWKRVLIKLTDERFKDIRNVLAIRKPRKLEHYNLRYITGQSWKTIICLSVINRMTFSQNFKKYRNRMNYAFDKIFFFFFFLSFFLLFFIFFSSFVILFIYLICTTPFRIIHGSKELKCYGTITSSSLSEIQLKEFYRHTGIKVDIGFFYVLLLKFILFGKEILW